jgi:hypothetical protein
MNAKTRLITLSMLLVAALALSACSTAVGASSKEVTTQQSFSDPFAYCAAVGQIDTPDARYTGPNMSDTFFKAYLRAARLDPNGDYPDSFKQMTIWRCMNGKVYACNFGANIPCDSKANTDKTPTQEMKSFCQSNREADFIPMSVTGHNVIYSWHCVKGAPEILEQIDTVDAAGYQSSFWQLVEPVP